MNSKYYRTGICKDFDSHEYKSLIISKQQKGFEVEAECVKCHDKKTFLCSSAEVLNDMFKCSLGLGRKREIHDIENS